MTCDTSCAGDAASQSSGDSQQASRKALSKALGDLTKAKEAKASQTPSVACLGSPLKTLAQV